MVADEGEEFPNKCPARMSPTGPVPRRESDRRTAGLFASFSSAHALARGPAARPAHPGRTWRRYQSIVRLRPSSSDTVGVQPVRLCSRS
jgi:hypothetical protein